MTPKKRITITVLCIIGLILSIDLVYIYIKTNFIADAPKSFCSINSFVDCDGVAQTPKAFFLGVPLAIWGVILYCLFLFLNFVDKIREKINFPLLNVFKNPSSYIASIGLLSFIIITDVKNTILDFIQGVKQYTTLFLAVMLVLVLGLGYFQRSLILAPNLKMVKSIEEFRQMKTNIYAIEGNTLGNPDGDVSIYVYGDFMCPFCKIMNIMLHKLVIDDKNVAVYHVNFPLDSACNPTVVRKIHPGGCILSKYALAAQNQGNYWGMVSAIYTYMPKDEKQLLGIGNLIGLDSDKLYTDAHSKQIDETLENQIYRGIGARIMGTPTIIIDDIPHSEIMPYYRLKELVHQSRKRKTKNAK